ncbi:MarR family transcriptional regulator [Streptomyces sp. MJM8645]|uniref:MarR family transcriptional regulator n=1 Tax=Streptomycetaceae TaxID=2062 RepID=UPI0007AF039A|nr:MarR family transcriptional regulator [Streptomyces sp. MJM8645]
MTTTAFLTRAPGPVIAALGLTNACFVPPASTTFVLSLALSVSGLLLVLDDVHESDLRRDTRVLAVLARTPGGARVRRIGCALGLRDRTVARSLGRLTDDGLVIPDAGNQPLPLRTYRLAD